MSKSLCKLGNYEQLTNLAGKIICCSIYFFLLFLYLEKKGSISDIQLMKYDISKYMNNLNLLESYLSYNESLSNTDCISYDLPKYSLYRQEINCLKPSKRLASDICPKLKENNHIPATHFSNTLLNISGFM